MVIYHLSLGDYIKLSLDSKFCINSIEADSINYKFFIVLIVLPEFLISITYFFFSQIFSS